MWPNEKTTGKVTTVRAPRSLTVKKKKKRGRKRTARPDKGVDV